MHKTFSNRGQGAVEYLLIIGAAILVSAVVIIASSGILTEGRTSIDVNDIKEVNDPLRQQFDNSNNTTPSEPTYNLNDPQVYYLELSPTTNPITIGELLKNAPNYTSVEIDTNFYKKLTGPFTCVKGTSWVNCESDLVLPGTKFKINLLNSQAGFDINQEIISPVPDNYAELTLSPSIGEKFLYFTPDINTIPELFSNAPNGAYILIKNAQNLNIYKTYRKNGSEWGNEYDTANGLFDNLEQDDNALINLMIGNDTKITGTTNAPFNTFTISIESYPDGDYTYIFKKFVIGSDIKCYDINKLFNKIENAVGTNFSVRVQNCEKSKGDETLGEMGYQNYYSCPNENRQITSADVIELSITLVNPNPIPEITFDCN